MCVSSVLKCVLERQRRWERWWKHRGEWESVGVCEWNLWLYNCSLLARKIQPTLKVESTQSIKLRSVKRRQPLLFSAEKELRWGGGVGGWCFYPLYEMAWSANFLMLLCSKAYTGSICFWQETPSSLFWRRMEMDGTTQDESENADFLSCLHAVFAKTPSAHSLSQPWFHYCIVCSNEDLHSARPLLCLSRGLLIDCFWLDQRMQRLTKQSTTLYIK